MAKNVKMYTTPTCVYCKMAKNFFKEHNVAYQEFNVQEDLQAQHEMIAKSQQLGVPVFDIDGNIYVGFDRSALAQALGIQ